VNSLELAQVVETKQGVGAGAGNGDSKEPVYQGSGGVFKPLFVFPEAHRKSLYICSP